MQYLWDEGVDLVVFKNDEKTCDEIREMNPRGILISPGPGARSQAAQHALQAGGPASAAAGAGRRAGGVRNRAAGLQGARTGLSAVRRVHGAPVHWAVVRWHVACPGGPRGSNQRQPGNISGA